MANLFYLNPLKNWLYIWKIKFSYFVQNWVVEKTEDRY